MCSETNRGRNHDRSIRSFAGGCAKRREREREGGQRSVGEGGWTGGELALFYRKGLIALPITDNATINDLREVGLGRNGMGRDRREVGQGRGREWE